MCDWSVLVKLIESDAGPGNISFPVHNLSPESCGDHDIVIGNFTLLQEPIEELLRAEIGNDGGPLRPVTKRLDEHPVAVRVNVIDYLHEEIRVIKFKGGLYWHGDISVLVKGSPANVGDAINF